MMTTEMNWKTMSLVSAVNFAFLIFILILLSGSRAFSQTDFPKLSCTGKTFADAGQVTSGGFIKAVWSAQPSQDALEDQLKPGGGEKKVGYTIEWSDLKKITLNSKINGENEFKGSCQIEPNSPICISDVRGYLIPFFGGNHYINQFSVPNSGLYVVALCQPAN